MKKDIRYVPYPQFCCECKYREPKQIFTSFDEPNTVAELDCEYSDICKNAIELHGRMTAEFYIWVNGKRKGGAE